MFSLRNAAGAALVLASLTGCYDRNAQQSEIIRLMEASGSGSLSTYSAPGLQRWLSARPKLAEKVAAMCGPISRRSTADWATTAEGMTCVAATRVRALGWNPETMKVDQRGW